jgi:hypothetical protein
MSPLDLELAKPRSMNVCIQRGAKRGAKLQHLSVEASGRINQPSNLKSKRTSKQLEDTKTTFEAQLRCKMRAPFKLEAY